MLNFKISELVKSSTAKEKNIDNSPDIDSLDNLLELIFFCLQPLRNLIKKPVIITSGFRCEKLNKEVNGAKNSQHLKGQAADFKIKGMKIDEIIEIIKKSDIVFDQLINEYDKWVHISYNKNKNRKQILKL